jgi:hypothetical protein
VEGKVDATLLWSDFHREDYAVSNIGKVYPHYKNGNGSGSGEGGGGLSVHAVLSSVELTLNIQLFDVVKHGSMPYYHAE